MKLTLKTLISFLEKEYPYNLGFSPKFIFREVNDGLGAADFLERLSKEFNISFENFDFRKYFLEESELNTMTLGHLLRIKRQREIEKELTIQMLFDYMISNVKNLG